MGQSRACALLFDVAQVVGGVITADVLTQLVQELIADQQQPLASVVHSGPEASAAAHANGVQHEAGPVLVCRSADGGDVVFVGQLYDQAAAQLLEVRC